MGNIAELCNGSTYDSDSYCLGSNPSSAARIVAAFVYQDKGGFLVEVSLLPWYNHIVNLDLRQGLRDSLEERKYHDPDTYRIRYLLEIYQRDQR